MTVWTDEHIAKLKKLHAEGYSFSRIGNALGITRAACIGKANRLGLERRGAWGDPDKRARAPARHRQPSARPQTFAAIEHYAPDDIEALLTELPAEAIPLAQRKTFAQLKPRDCRFIYGDPSSRDFFYCGAGNNFRSVYCAYHYGVTHRLSRSSTAKPERPGQDSIAA